jgi:hypothetical protein
MSWRTDITRIYWPAAWATRPGRRAGDTAPATSGVRAAATGGARWSRGADAGGQRRDGEAPARAQLASSGSPLGRRVAHGRLQRLDVFAEHDTEGAFACFNGLATPRSSC